MISIAKAMCDGCEYIDSQSRVSSLQPKPSVPIIDAFVRERGDECAVLRRAELPGILYAYILRKRAKAE